MKRKTAIFSLRLCVLSFLLSGCTMVDKESLMHLDKSANQDRHVEFEQQLLPIHQRTDIIRQELEDIENKRKKR